MLSTRGRLAVQFSSLTTNVHGVEADNTHQDLHIRSLGVEVVALHAAVHSTHRNAPHQHWQVSDKCMENAAVAGAAAAASSRMELEVVSSQNEAADQIFHELEQKLVQVVVDGFVKSRLVVDTCPMMARCAVSLRSVQVLREWVDLGMESNAAGFAGLRGCCMKWIFEVLIPRTCPLLGLVLDATLASLVEEELPSWA